MKIITFTNTAGKKIRVMVERIMCYEPNGSGSEVTLTEDYIVLAKETPEQIDELLINIGVTGHFPQ